MLIVEDDDDTLEAITAILAREGAIVTKVSTFAEAMDILRAGVLSGSRPDAIVCDLMLPDTTGIRLPVEIRKLDPEWRVPLVAISGHPDAEEPARHAGFDGFLPKLISPLLPMALAELMRGPR